MLSVLEVKLCIIENPVWFSTLSAATNAKGCEGMALSFSSLLVFVVGSLDDLWAGCYKIKGKS